ncbi:MAG: hypothetical protein IPJ07_14465 [Acidobacteria bacterium]|nr:hypothetical protein [Acidobacteriota bacterium]
MAEVNRAYEKGDLSRLQELLYEWTTSPERLKGESVGDELVKVIRNIARVENRIAAIDNEINYFMNSEIQQLRKRIEEVGNEGRDLLLEMADDLDRDIRESKAEGYDILLKLVNKMDGCRLFSE